MKPARNLNAPHMLRLMLLFAVATPATAFNLESNDPIRLSADSARVDDSQGVAIYRGNVEVTQGNTRLTADRVELLRGSKGLERIDAEGSPATYHQPAAGNEAATDAEARIIRYSASENRLRFEQDAVVKQDRDEFRGAVIDYDSANRVVTGEGRTPDGEGSGRVEMVIHPRGNGSSDDNGTN